MATKFFILSSRSLIASPAWASAFELEDLIVEWCEATLLSPLAKDFYQHSKLHTDWTGKLAGKVSKFLGEFHEITDVVTKTTDLNILLMIDMSADTLRKVSSIPEWRKKFDIVAAHVEDCWLFDSFPDCVIEFDHLFIPYSEFKAEIETLFNIPVTVLPYAFDVLSHGAGKGDRPIDVASYGRNPKNYQLQLHKEFNSANSGLLYYHQAPEKASRFPNIPYGLERFDYLHRLQLKQILRRSKLNLAFDFSYTSSQDNLDPSMKNHPSHKCNQSILTRRWFESIGTGSVVVGKKPESGMLNQYFGWEDATIELPDDAVEGVEFIRELLNRDEYLKTIHQRNYAKSLEHNDWRTRLSDMFRVLDIPIPEGLNRELDKLSEKVHETNYHLV